MLVTVELASRIYLERLCTAPDVNQFLLDAQQHARQPGEGLVRLRSTDPDQHTYIRRAAILCIVVKVAKPW